MEKLEHIDQKVDAVVIQTTKTNGRTTKNEKDIAHIMTILKVTGAFAVGVSIVKFPDLIKYFAVVL